MRFAKRLSLYILAIIAGIWVLYISAMYTTIDLYYGTITQPPKVSINNEREIGLLAPGESVADTINIEDFCWIPFTDYCRWSSADIHNSFIVGKTYCVSAYGWRLGILSLKPNLVAIEPEAACQDLL